MLRFNSVSVEVRPVSRIDELARSKRNANSRVIGRLLDVTATRCQPQEYSVRVSCPDQLARDLGLVTGFYCAKWSPMPSI